ncbi:hypothetical protein [Pararhodobacter aggregans]|nr:hypothetical protein [Pararhodobacter aggregans]PTX02042.1 hypothetical protein C8N33_106261 [Pararhodobacter aggregans]
MTWFEFLVPLVLLIFAILSVFQSRWEAGRLEKKLQELARDKAAATPAE